MAVRSRHGLPAMCRRATAIRSVCICAANACRCFGAIAGARCARNCMTLMPRCARARQVPRLRPTRRMHRTWAARSRSEPRMAEFRFEGVSKRFGSPATHLSGGQMQRVALGRALVRQPAVTLMDEPLSSLDARLRAELRVELKRIQVELGASVLYVTHDQIEAMTLATRIGVLEQG